MLIPLARRRSQAPMIWRVLGTDSRRRAIANKPEVNNDITAVEADVNDVAEEVGAIESCFFVLFAFVCAAGGASSSR
jgi:hypothetical protein